MAICGNNDQERLTAMNSIRNRLNRGGINPTDCKITNDIELHKGYRKKILQLKEEIFMLKAKLAETN